MPYFIFSEENPGTKVFNVNTNANIEHTVGDSEIVLSHSGVIELEVSVSGQVNLVSGHTAVVTMDVYRNVKYS